MDKSKITQSLIKKNKYKIKPGYSQLDWIQLNKNKTTNYNYIDDLCKVRKITLSELKEHNLKNDCWISINDKVYDITKYLNYHPGGINTIMMGAGCDGTKLFEEHHNWVSIGNILKNQFLGLLIN